MKSGSATITFSIVAFLTPNDLLTPKGYKFYNKIYIYIKCYFVKLEAQFSQNLLSIGCDIFLQVMATCFHLVKHVSLAFNTLSSISSYSKNKIVKCCHEM